MPSRKAMVDRRAIIERLSGINDPELGMSIVDLGLLYSIDHRAEIPKVSLTLTYPGCPFGPQIIEEIQKKLRGWGEINDVAVDITFDPPWRKEMIAPEVLEELRFLGRIR